MIDSKTILKFLPHKAPFLMLDKVIELEPGVSAVGIKNVTINEPYFAGHFPTEPIVPGVLIVESLAQLTAIMYVSGSLPKDTDWNNLSNCEFDERELASKVGYLVEIKNIKFKQVVKPGDTMRLRVRLRGCFGALSLINVAAYVDNTCVAEGQIAVSQRP